MTWSADCTVECRAECTAECTGECTAECTSALTAECTAEFTAESNGLDGPWPCVISSSALNIFSNIYLLINLFVSAIYMAGNVFQAVR